MRARADHPHSRPACSKATARTSRRCARSPAVARRCSSPSIAAPPASSRWPKRATLGARRRRHRSPSGRRDAAAGGRDRQSEPPRRSLRARPSRRRRPRLPDGGRAQPRAAPPRLLERARGRSRTCSLWLDLVALGTVADVVPLKGLNRAFVAKGLIALRRARARRADGADGRRAAQRPAGAVASRLPARPAHQCRRSHRPRRSRRAAADRARPDRGRRRSPPSSTGSTASARRSKQRRSRKPRPRRTAALGIEEKGAVVVTAAEGWHPGVVGLVAARLKERFGRPAFAIALEPGGIGTGSGRSIPGVDLGAVVRRAVADGPADQGRRPCDGGGRHACARTRSRLPRLSRRALADAVEAARREHVLLIDGAVTAARRHHRAGRDDRAGRPVRRRQSRADAGAAVRTRSSMPTRSDRRMSGRGCGRATAPSSTPSRFARSASRSGRR